MTESTTAPYAMHKPEHFSSLDKPGLGLALTTGLELGLPLLPGSEHIVGMRDESGCK
jgi:hypothetical protein